MTITITRFDPLSNIGTDSHEPGILSTENFPDMQLAIQSLRARGIEISNENATQFFTHDDTQFQYSEMVNNGISAYLCNVQYDVRVTNHSGETK